MVIYANRPQVALREAGQHTAGKGHVGAIVVKAVIAGGQGLQIGGIVNDHMVPRRQHRLLRLCGIGGIHGVGGVHRVWSIPREPEELQAPRRGVGGNVRGKSQIIAAWIAKPVAAQLPLGSGLLQGPDAVVGHHRPDACFFQVFRLVDVVAGFGSIVQILAIARILYVETAVSSNEIPNAIGVTGAGLPIYNGQIGRHEPGTGGSGGRHKGGCGPAVCCLDAGTVNQILPSRNVFCRSEIHLGIGCSIRSESRRGQHGQNHSHQQQPRQESAPVMCTHKNPPFCSCRSAECGVLPCELSYHKLQKSATVSPSLFQRTSVFCGN